MFTAEICVALDHVSEAQLWLKQFDNVKKTLHIAVTRPEVMEYLYVNQIVQKFTENAYRKNIVVRAKCLLIYYINVFKLF